MDDATSNSDEFSSEFLSKVQRQLAPAGVLRAAINLSNFLLVSGKNPDGTWRGVAPDMAKAIADALDLELELVAFDTPSEVVAAVGTGAWSVALVGAEPARARHIAFADPYVEIEAGYLVPPGSNLAHADEVDRPGHRIAAFRGSAYDVWLTSNLRHATLVHAGTFDAAFDRFRNEGIEALASLKPKLLADRQAWPGTRILPGSFMTVQQSLGVASEHREAARFLQRFVQRARDTGLIARLIDEHQAAGLTVAQRKSPG